MTGTAAVAIAGDLSLGRYRDLLPPIRPASRDIP
jgi:hypothetical protein